MSYYQKFILPPLANTREGRKKKETTKKEKNSTAVTVLKVLCIWNHTTFDE